MTTEKKPFYMSHRELQYEVEKLRTFKKYVHDRFDAASVPADPEPAANAKHGCRIEGRINWLLKQREELKQLVLDQEHFTGRLVREGDAAEARIEMLGRRNGALAEMLRVVVRGEKYTPDQLADVLANDDGLLDEVRAQLRFDVLKEAIHATCFLCRDGVPFAKGFRDGVLPPKHFKQTTVIDGEPMGLTRECDAVALRRLVVMSAPPTDGHPLADAFEAAEGPMGVQSEPAPGKRP